MYVLGIRLADGTQHLFETARLPRHWKSWVMHQLPYGTVFTGCEFFRTVKPCDDAATR